MLNLHDAALDWRSLTIVFLEDVTFFDILSFPSFLPPRYLPSTFCVCIRTALWGPRLPFSRAPTFNPLMVLDVLPLLSSLCRTWCQRPLYRSGRRGRPIAALGYFARESTIVGNKFGAALCLHTDVFKRYLREAQPSIMYLQSSEFIL